MASGLLKEHPKKIAFGFLNTAQSSVGQTFLISLFVPSFLAHFHLSPGEIGTFFSLSTLASALLMPFLGRFIDFMPLRRHVIIVQLGMVAVCFWMAATTTPWMLLVGLFGLRLFGRGLCIHTAATTMARYFGAQRGKALSFAGLGISIAECFLPVLIVTSVQWVGWRWSWIAIALSCALIFSPSLVALSQNFDLKKISESRVTAAMTPSQVLLDPGFYLLMPLAVVAPFLLTGLIFYQADLAGEKMWTQTLMASSFLAFAVSRLVGGLVSGPLVDRYSAGRIFLFVPFPLIFALQLLDAFEATWVAWGYYGLSGLTVGMAGNVNTALWAEIYGTKSLGAIRGTISMFTTISTAISPVVCGLLLDRQVTLVSLLPWLPLGIGALLILAWFGLRLQQRNLRYAQTGA